MDKGYDYDGVRAIVQEFGFTAHIRTRGEEARAIKQEVGFKARRWVPQLDGSFPAHLRWEKRAATYLAMLHLTLGIITSRATALLG